MNKKHGFTLIELLIVVMIIAALTSVALPQYRRTIQRSEATEAITNLRTIFEAAVRYRAEHSSSPTKVTQIDVGFYDAIEQTAGQSDIGDFRYTFRDESITVCRLKNSGTTWSVDNANTYCFTINYRPGVITPELNGLSFNAGMGEILCWGHGKYQHVCPGFGNSIGHVSITGGPTGGTDIFLLE